jgi:prepilin signal peptidase PulO-like enzyme (type II secretory pathway)
MLLLSFNHNISRSMIFLYFLFGSCFGSFISCLSYRLPNNENFINKRSFCPKCKHSLGIKDLFPIFSWILANGKCNYCKKEISIRYPLIEIFTGLSFALIHLLNFQLHTEIVMLVLTFALITIIIIDLEHYIIPDSMQFIVLICAISFAIIHNYSLTHILISGIAGFSSIYIISFLFKKIRKKEGIGFGDIKFITSAAIFLGYQNLVLFFLFSGILGVINGLIWQKLLKKPCFPFAPSLSASLFLCLIIPYSFAKSYEENFDLLSFIFSKLIN